MKVALLFSLQCIYVIASADDSARARRDLSMLRMGKRSEFSSLPPLVPPSYDLSADDFDERQVWMKIPRVGKDIDEDTPHLRLARYPPVPRLGSALDSLIEEYRRDIGSNDDEDEIRQVLFKIPRVGRNRRSADDQENVEMKEQVKRAAPLPRLGMLEERAAPLPRLGLYERAAFLPRLGYRDLDEEERAAPLPRLGVREEDYENEVGDNSYLKEEDERAAPLPRLGYYEKRNVGMLRMGKRPMSMLRMGKRPMSMLRMGKRPMSMLRMGKRPMSMLRMGRSMDEAQPEQQKRAMSMLRMGKRGMNLLRMGRSEQPAEEEEKRAMSMLRMGRSEPAVEAEKRPMSMLRMGKRPMSMLRMGKREMDDEVIPVVEAEKRPMNMLRMGKRDTDDNQPIVEEDQQAQSS
ncbi:hypothetical protein CAPTEDRAFT_226517 [Capitella teleta]|uniref:Uncharacterized protein n=1 Tax=Capitella teleta TaxID=283909 RepID=R7V3P8_CAPTE|nr:hypothetical protein CAPTEDRAFT_226517 [Capitella teleta]|eukprot:ELU10430.1 hypothetical protein CAPTEDRAFT_226517 [Capitella teleta]